MNRTAIFAAIAVFAALAFGFSGKDSQTSQISQENNEKNSSANQEIADIDLSGWDTFSSDEYEFKYPKEALFDNVAVLGVENSRVKFFGEKQVKKQKANMSAFDHFAVEDGYAFWIAKVKSKEVDAKSYAESELKKHKIECKKEKSSQISDIKNVKINGKDAYSFSVKNCFGNYDLSYLENNGSLYKISQFYVGDENDKEKYFKTTNAILLTLKFK